MTTFDDFQRAFEDGILETVSYRLSKFCGGYYSAIVYQHPITKDYIIADRLEWNDNETLPEYKLSLESLIYFQSMLNDTVSNYCRRQIYELNSI